MSLSTVKLDSPQVIGALSLGCAGLFPFVKGTFEKTTIPWVVVQGASACAYGVSFWTVARRGKVGGNKSSKSGKKNPAKAEKAPQKKKKKFPTLRTFLPPDSWGLMIWAPIYVGQCLMVGTQMAVTESSALAPIVREITGPYVFAQIFQGLWSLSFRPEYGEGIYKYIAAFNLSGMAVSMSFCHLAFTRETSRETYPRIDYLLNFMPLALHFGWTSITALVNWNASLALEEKVSSEHMAYVGHGSVAVAVITGVGVTIKRTAPMYGLAIAWGLSAIASGLTKKIDEAENEEEKATKTFKATFLQRNLSLGGAAVCAIVAAAVGLRRKKTS